MQKFEHKPDTGSMWRPKEIRSDKSPRWRGEIVLSRELIERARAGEPIQISAWESTTRSGLDYISLVLSKKWRPPENGDLPPDREIPRSNAPVEDEEAPF